ncbi:MAG: prepilin peptidase [Acetobacteraceae bacterium]
MTAVFILLGIALMLAAALHDMAARTIPNGISVALALLGVASGIAEGHLISSMLLGSGVFGLAVLCWRAGWLGGGDVKLFGAAALALPPGSVPTFIAASAIGGGVLALLYLTLGRVVAAPSPVRPAGLLARALRAEQWRIRRRGPLPYVCAIASGFLFVVI